MAIIREEFTQEDSNLELNVLERSECEIENREPGEIISLCFDDIVGWFTPEEIRVIGTWLIEKAKYVEKTYNDAGIKKDPNKGDE